MAPLLRSRGHGGERDPVQSRRRQGVERAGRDRRAVQHLVREDAVPDRRPAPVRVPEGDGLGPPRRPGGVQRVQHHDVRDQVRGRQHRLPARPLRPLLLHQRQPGQLHGRREAHRRRARRQPHPAGPLADSSPLHAAPVPSPASPPPSPPSMPPTSAAPVPSPSPSSPPSPPSMAPPAGAPVPSPSSPPSMAPPSGAPTASPSAGPVPAPAATPESAPSPTGFGPGAAPAAAPGSSPSSSPGAPASPPSSSPGTPGGVPQPPSDTTSPPAPAPAADGANSTTPGSGAAQVTAGVISTLAAGLGYAMLAF